MKPLKDTDEIKNSSMFIGYVDLIGKGNVKLTIADVEDASREKIGMRETKSGTYAVSFKEVPGRKKLVQGEQLKYLMRTFGKKKSEWIGREIELYADPDVYLGAEKVGGLRIVGQRITKRKAE